jgi:hypothetical protein
MIIDYFVIWTARMIKARVGARQLAEMISAKIGTAGLEILVRRDHADGWQPTVVAAPGSLIFFQREAEEIAKRLRMDFDLDD